MEHEKLDKKNAAIVFSLTSNMTFALASVLLDLKCYCPHLADEIVVFHDGIKSKDKRALRSIMNTRFIEYDFPIKDLSVFEEKTIKYFSKMVFGKFECFRLLSEYRNVLYLDYDQIIKADISELLVPCESGLKMIPSDSKVKEGLFSPIESFDMERKSICASIFVVQDNLKDFDKIYEWCYAKIHEYAKHLYLPEQVILDFMLQEFHIQPLSIDRSIYCCHPGKVEYLENAKVIHAFGQPKFWNGWGFKQWNDNYQVWKEMGGSRFIKASSPTWKKVISKMINAFRELKETLINIIDLYAAGTPIRDLSLFYKYFLSEQYKKNSWTFAQCRQYALKFEQAYYSESFVNDFASLLRGFDPDSQKKLKFIFARMLFFSFLNKHSLYDEDEQAMFCAEKDLDQNIKKMATFYQLGEYKFINNNMTIHNFVDDMGLRSIEGLDEIKDRSIIDVGAYIGDSSLILSKYTNEKVHAFEPFNKAYEELMLNIALNNSLKIVPLNLGLSDRCGVKKLYFAKGDNLSVSTYDPEKSLTKGEYEVVEISTITIDKYVEDNNIRIGIIKIDAEGSEQEVLAGAQGVIRRDKPIMLVSIYHNINDFIRIKPWIESLKDGYKYKIIKSESTTFVEETMLVCY